MKSLKIFILLLSAAFLTYYGCKDNSSISESGENNSSNGTSKVVLQGQVINAKTNVALDSVTIQVIGEGVNYVAYTDYQGKYKFEFDLTKNVSVTITAYKNQYLPDSVKVVAVMGSTVNVSNISLQPTTVISSESGSAASIYLVSASPNNINVIGSGGIEKTTINFQVLDSLGNHINIIHADTVFFKLASSLGGEFLYPNIGITNDSGMVQVTLTSGTKAGVVQIYAEMHTKTGKIFSKPVFISIHGGLPDLAHFSIGPKVYNFPGLDVYGLQLPISVIVGDKYANPVKPNTAVYFTTTGGVIEGSLLTDLQGRGTVNLISGEPEPVHALYGPGFATITASTADENLQQISKSTIVLVSGFPIISCSPTSFNIPNGGVQNFSFIVADRNGNPLAMDNKISVSLQGENAAIQGDVDITLPDTQSKTWTRYNFLVYDAVDTIDVAKPLTIRIKSEGSNGKAFLTLTGTGH
ncbi:MAG: hypothetical protein Q8903_02780 [Bacteroidota bacterium]|nr:hypothetical protein [Bacteroidota bacterium]